MEPSGTIAGYDPTWRERAGAKIADLIEGLGVNRWKANKIAQTVAGGERSNLPMGSGLLDLALMVSGSGAAVPAAARAAGSAGGLLAYADASREGNPFSAIFGGVMAKTADKAALAKAQALDKSGADPRAIWKDTGWFKGGDGKWRFEIDDSAMRLLRSRAGGARSAPPVSSVVEHPELWKAYPDIAAANTSVRIDPKKKHFDGGGASYPKTMNASGNYALGVSGATKSDVLSNYGHELQHIVQMKEGLAKGGAGSYYTPAMESEKNAVEAILEDRWRVMNAMYANPEHFRGVIFSSKGVEQVPDPSMWTPEFRDWMGASKKLEALKTQAYENYRRLAGEAEARAVQKRMNLTAGERRARFPFDDYDVPLDELIYRTDGMTK